MARPGKSAVVLETEGKSHRTKAELKTRKAAEQALLTGRALREAPEVKASEPAHREFLRVSRLLKKVGRNDALYESIINRYCLLAAECAEAEAVKAEFRASREELRAEYKSGIGEEELSAAKYYRLLERMQQNILSVDRAVQQKRQMMLAIEKECAMTIVSAGRSIPKAAEPKKNPLLEALMGEDEDDEGE